MLGRLAAAAPEHDSSTAGRAAWEDDDDDTDRLMQRADADLYAHERRRS